MPAVARKDRADTVDSPDGAGDHCASPSTQSTDVGSTNVFVNGIGAVRQGDAMISHPEAGDCAPHAPTLSAGSSTVFVNGKQIGRLGDAYSGHTISSGSPNVFAGG